MSMNRIRRDLTGLACATALVGGMIGFTTPAAQAASSSEYAFKPTLSYYTCPPKSQPTGVRCATLTVPLDWQTPDDGRTTTIDVRVKRSKQGDGALTFNPGGPGGSGVSIFHPIYEMLPKKVTSRFDFIGWDPRGVGKSGPRLTGCKTLDVNPPSTGPVDWQAFWQEITDATAAANTACLAANPNSVPYLGTWQVIRDLDALRETLGYEKWNYWGMSYGTRIGRAYAQTFPNKLRALVMDGSLMADESMFRFGTTFPSNFWESIQIYPSLTKLSASHKITTIQKFLDASVLTLPDGAEYTRWSWLGQLRALLTSQDRYRLLHVLINSLYTGFTAESPEEREEALTVVAEINKALSSDEQELSESSGVLAIVNCSDMHDRPTVKELATASESIDRNYGVLLPVFMGNAASCFGLDPDALSPKLPSVSSMIKLKNAPVFVLSTGDAATPWVWGRSLANAFTGSRTISYDGTQHVAYMGTPSTCVNKPVTQYLLTLKMPTKNLMCAFAPPKAE